MNNKTKDTNELRREATKAFLNYQSSKYDLSGIIPLQNEYHGLRFENCSCYIGEIKLKETTYICDSILPNHEVKNVILEVKRLFNDEWQVILKVNFFGLSLCVYHTKEKQYYFVGVPNNFVPQFKIIAEETNPNIHRNDNMI